jgi:hypothetical protein
MSILASFSILPLLPPRFDLLQGIDYVESMLVAFGSLKIRPQSLEAWSLFNNSCFRIEVGGRVAMCKIIFVN